MLLTKLWYRCLTYNRNPGLHSKLALNHEIPTSENHCLKHTTMRRHWTEERRQNRIEADWIVAWLRDNGPATIREIVQALEAAGRDVKAHVIRRALQKSQFIEKTGEIEIDGEVHSQYEFTND